jgi:large subunit ribosomal protein L25
MDLDLGDQGTTALIREVERDPITGAVIHLGFQRVDLRENIRSAIPLVFHGEEALIANGLVFERQLAELEVHGRADQLPEAIMVEVGEAEAGHMFRVADLQIPEGIEVTRDPETVIARVSEPKVSADVAAALDAEEAAHAAAVEEREEEAAAEATEAAAEA